MADTMLVRRDSAADWTSNDTVLGAGEIGLEEDTNRLKVGDGSTAWTSLDYLSNLPTVLNHTEAALDIASVAAAGTLDTSVTITGAATGDVVIANPVAAIEAGLVWSAYVSAADTVKLRIANVTAGAIDPAAVDWNFEIFQR